MSSAPPLRIRPADGADARWAAQLWAESFPGEPRAEVRLQALLEGTGPYGGLETCWVAESEGRLVGAFRYYPLRMHLWGRAFPTQGLASVAVTPAARRQGVGRALCRLALSLAREKGALLGALYPFRVDYYRRIGYALVGELHRYRYLSAELNEGSAEGVASGDDPDGRRTERGVQTLLGGHPKEERLSVERIPREEAGRRLAAPYQALLSRSNGLVERTPEMWKGILDDAGHVYGAMDAGGGLRGYLLAHGRRGRSPDRSILRIRECLALDGGARDALFAWISDQRDQWRWVEYDALPGEEFHRLLPHPRQAGRPHARGLWFPSATLLRGPMLRIVNLGRVLETVGFPAGARLAVADPEFPENSGEWQGGNGGPRRTEGSASRPERSGATPPQGIDRVTEAFVQGRLPGQGSGGAFEPALGLTDFRLLDIF